ncbi:palmitoyl-acyl carrier protein thioesterase, chloroplastic-like [Typha angustifolia]|uniref:palmitoyl-acyl carrier protein thioesterase, chloroplastic-like n=1 Tax=Typha angustifolia TaxID=59011 RepID=UPI003C2B87CD
MSASIMASSSLPLPSSSSSSAASARAASDSLDVRGFAAKTTSATGAMQLNASSVQATPITSSSAGGLKSENIEVEDDSNSLMALQIFYNQLPPDWSKLLVAITTAFLATEKQRSVLDWKVRRTDMLADAFGLGKFVKDGPVFRQNFFIRSYEIEADQTASIEALMNQLQETALNHMKCAGLLVDGFGSTPEMYKRSLIWVVTKMQVHVEKYPSWGDVIQVETWVFPSGKNAMRRDWHVKDAETGKTILKATSLWVMMNKKTRRLSKVPEEVRTETEPYFLPKVAAILDDDGRRLPKLDTSTATHVQKGLSPHWSDLDTNQHVNNVKYIGWILESSPISILENYELESMILEYRRECRRGSVLDSLTTVSAGADCINGNSESRIECQHLLQFEGGAEIMRGQTQWRHKQHRKNTGSVGVLPTASS